MIRKYILKRLCLLSLAMATFVGCGESEKPSGTVSGKVSFNGVPVVAGNINFMSANGIGAQAEILGGDFQVDGSLATGEYSVYVNPPLPEPQPPGTPPKPMPKFDVPAKFQSPSSSETKVTVKPGTNTIPIDFK